MIPERAKLALIEHTVMVVDAIILGITVAATLFVVFLAFGV